MTLFLSGCMNLLGVRFVITKHWKFDTLTPWHLNALQPEAITDWEKTPVSDRSAKKVHTFLAKPSTVYFCITILHFDTDTLTSRPPFILCLGCQAKYYLPRSSTILPSMGQSKKVCSMIEILELKIWVSLLTNCIFHLVERSCFPKEMGIYISRVFHHICT